jgi:hypothetical protein
MSNSEVGQMPIPHSSLPKSEPDHRFDPSFHVGRHHESANDRVADFEDAMGEGGAAPLVQPSADGKRAFVSTPSHNYVVHDYHDAHGHQNPVPKGWAESTVNDMYAAAESPHMVVHGHAFVHPDHGTHHFAKHLDRGILPIGILNSQKVPEHVAERIRKESAKVALVDFLVGNVHRGSSTLGVKMDPATGHATHLITTDNSHGFNYEDPASTNLAYLLNKNWYPMHHTGVYSDLQKEQAIKGAAHWMVEHGPFIRKALVANLAGISDDETKMHILSNFMKRYDIVHQIAHDVKTGVRMSDVLHHKTVDAPGSVASRYSVEG